LGYVDSIRLSADGTNLVVGLPAHDTEINGTVKKNDGIARVYQFTNNDWVQVGADIAPTLTESNSSGSFCGAGVDIDLSGDRVAIGCPHGSGDDNKEDVFIYTYSSNNWTQEGRLSRDDRGSWFGEHVRMNDDGDAVSVTARNYHLRDFSRYERNSNNNWNINGDRITNSISMDMSSSGNFVAIGNKEWGTNDDDRGMVEVYKVTHTGPWSQVTYTQLSTDLLGTNSYDKFGHNLAMSSPNNTDGDGLVVAIGSPGYEPNFDSNTQNCPFDGNYGKVNIFKYSASTDSFSSIGVIYGADVDGVEACDQFSYSGSGSSIDLSDDGTIMAVGTHEADDGAGAIFIYQNISDIWSLKYKISGNEISGNDDTNFAKTLNLSSDGMKLATSNWSWAIGKGEVKIYDLKEIF